jgi:hypothetical protein
VWVEDKLTIEDVQRACGIPVTPQAVTAAHVVLLEACDTVCQEILIPRIRQVPQPSARQTALIVLFYRMMGFVQTVVRLQSPVHQQSLTSAERSVIELWIDMELLHRDVIPDGVEKIVALVDFQKLKAARRTVRFFADHPELDATPSKAIPHRGFIDAKGVEVEATAKRLWPRPDGKSPKPDHWTGVNLEVRAKILGVSEELQVLEGYDMRNFAVHTGLAGVMGFDATAFEIMCSQAVQGISACMLSALKIMGEELDVHAHVDVYDKIIAALENVAGFVIVDNALRALGESQRYWWHKGPRPTVIATSDVH